MLPDHGGLDLPLPPPPEEGGCVEGRGCEAAAAAEVAAAAVNEAGDGRLLSADEGFPIFGRAKALPKVTEPDPVLVHFEAMDVLPAGRERLGRVGTLILREVGARHDK